MGSVKVPTYCLIINGLFLFFVVAKLAAHLELHIDRSPEIMAFEDHCEKERDQELGEKLMHGEALSDREWDRAWDYFAEKQP